jgi:uncharacterized membrane protein YccC
LALELAMSNAPIPRKTLRAKVKEHRAQLGLAVRVTIAAVLAFALSHLVFVPLPLWTVLTAVILTQVTFGRSVKATLDYLAGTVGGTIYAGGVSLLILHANDFSLAGILAIGRSAFGLPGSRHAELQRCSFHRRVGDPGSGICARGPD